MSMAFLEGAEYDYEAKRRDMSEVIAGLRNELHAKDKRIADLEFQYDAVRQLCNDHAQRIAELEQTILYLTAQCQECLEQLSEGKEYSEGCKP